MYGSPWIALNADVDNCRCFLFIGTNPAESGHGWVGHVADGWKRVLAAQEKESGCTIHLVNEIYDDGPIIAQARVPVSATDDETVDGSAHR